MSTLSRTIAVFPLRRLAGAIALCAALAVQAEAAATYTVTDLGDTYQVNGFQNKVLNDLGEVIGNTFGPTGGAYLYANGNWTSVGQLNNSGSGDTGTIVHGLNNTGLVVGESANGVSNPGFDQTDAFCNPNLGGFTALNLASSTNSYQLAVAYGCNDSGMIVGNVIDYSAGTRSTFFFSAAAGLISQRSDGIYSFAINRFGDVLGSTVDLVPQAVLNGAPLPAITAGFTPHAINNSGQILLSVDGPSRLAAGWGLIYNYGTGKATPLENLSPKSAGYTSFLDLNDAGDVVGLGSDESFNPHAVLYTTSKGLSSLDSLGLTSGGVAVHLTEADGINNVGQIVCLGYTTDATDVHAYLLTPVTASGLPLAATYDGIASVSGSSAGAVVIAIGKTNVASVTLKTPSLSYAFKVTLVNGSFTGSVTADQTSLSVTLQADAAHQNITGMIAAGSDTYDFTALRQVSLGIFAGPYTALLQIPGTNNSGLPQGIGYGEMTIGKTGAISIKGELGDGTAYAVAAVSHYDGSWSFYSPLYGKTQPGLIAGSIAANHSATASDYAGSLLWSKPGAFTTNLTFQGARFKAAKNTQLLQFTNATDGSATFTFSGGCESLSPQTLSVTNENIVTVTDPGSDALAVKLSTVTGSMTGSFITGGKTTFTGVVQQKLNLGGGVFLNQGTPGGVLLTPQ